MYECQLVTVCVGGGNPVVVRRKVHAENSSDQ